MSDGAAPPAVPKPANVEAATVQIVRVVADDPYMGIERLDQDEVMTIKKELVAKRLSVINGEYAHSADSVDMCLAAREFETGAGVEIAEATTRLFKLDEGDTRTWKWVAEVRGANYHAGSGVRGGYHLGMGDHAYNLIRRVNGVPTITDEPDPFSERKAVRIAQKKAKMLCLGDERLKVWEMMMRKFIDQTEITPADQRRIDEAREKMGVARAKQRATQPEAPPSERPWGPGGPTQKQVDYARSLGMTVTEGMTWQEVSALIDEGKKKRGGGA